MVASRQVEIPHYRGVGRERGMGFGALAEVIGRTADPFLHKYNAPAAKRIGADMLEFAAPEIGEVVCGRKYFKSAAKRVGKQSLKKQLGEGSRRRKGAVGGRELAEGSQKRKGAAGAREAGRQGGRKQRRIIPTAATKQSSRSRRDIFTNISH